jgi:precorrin-6A/cobalt-precorrin-6A reductase
MPNDSVLILGGTVEARELAAVLLSKGFEVISSLAGATDNPLLPEGKVRRGGFGGVEGLIAYLESERITAIADATHPFAAQISQHSYEAVQQVGIPFVRLERPPWQAIAGDQWTTTPSVLAAVAALPSGARALVTIGRKEIGAFFARTDIGGVARMIEAQALPVPERWSVILDRPPFGIEQEKSLLSNHRISHLVAKNAGGAETEAKISAARELGLPVIMISRPPKPQCETRTNAADLALALTTKLLP